MLSKKNWKSVLRKKLGFHTEFCEFRELRIFENFKKNSFASGQGVVQIKPNAVWSFTSVRTVFSKKYFWFSFLRKKVGFSYRTFWISRKRSFKNRFFFFIGLRSCPTQTKRGMEYHQCNESVKQKIFLV